MTTHGPSGQVQGASKNGRGVRGQVQATSKWLQYEPNVFLVSILGMQGLHLSIAGYMQSRLTSRAATGTSIDWVKLQRVPKYPKWLQARESFSHVGDKLSGKNSSSLDSLILLDAP